MGNLTGQTYPSGRVVNYGYDATGRLNSVADNQSGATQNYLSGAAYYAHGGVQQETWGNGAIQAVEFNSRLQPTAINLERSGNLLQRYEYKYGQVNIETGASDALNNGQVGRVDAFIGKNGTTPIKAWEQRFTYDSLGRLSRAREVRSDNNQSVWQQHYTYDAYGNRYQAPAGTAGQSNEGLPWLKVESSDINPQTNRYTLPNISYDTAGQITQDTYFRNSRYTYDANGRVRSWMTGAGASLKTNATDGVGQRVMLFNDTSWRRFIWDAFGRLVAEYTSGGGLESENIYRGGNSAPLARRSTSGGVTNVKWELTDHQGSVRLFVDAAGTATDRYDYTPFGEYLGAGVGTRTTTQGYSGAQLRQRFAGTTRDYTMTGLEDTPWRKMDAKAGRWTTPDPYNGSMSVGDPQSFNRYAYVGNDPVNFVDPSGLLSQPFYNVTDDGRPYVTGATPEDQFTDGTGEGAVGEAAYERRVQEAFDNYRATQRAAELARAALANGNAAALIAILQSNSNVGISINGQRFFGGQAVDAFNSFQQEQRRRGGDFGGGGAGGSWDDIRLYRFGGGKESLDKLRRDAEDAERKIGIYGVSVTSNTPRHPAPSALKSEVERYFTVQKTGGPGHYTVIFPKPLTQANADIFNNLFRNKHK